MKKKNKAKSIAEARLKMARYLQKVNREYFKNMTDLESALINPRDYLATWPMPTPSIMGDPVEIGRND